MKLALSAIDEIDGWIKDNRKQFADELASDIGPSAEVLERAVDRSNPGTVPIEG